MNQLQMNKKTQTYITFKSENADPETLAFVARKIQEAHLNELSTALKKASKAVLEGRNTFIRTKGVKIKLEALEG
jgi:hypothetical protein